MLWNEFHINLLTHLLNHICLQFHFAHSPLPAFSNVPTVTSLPFRTRYLRSAAKLCCKAKPVSLTTVATPKKYAKFYADIHFTSLHAGPVTLYDVKVHCTVCICAAVSEFTLPCISWLWSNCFAAQPCWKCCYQTSGR